MEVRAHGPAGDAPAGAVYHGRHARPGRSRRFLGALIAGASTAGRVVMVVDPDLVVPSWLWTRLRGQRLVVDLHEDYHAVSHDRPWTRGAVGPVARLLVRLAVLVATRADLTVVADDHVPPRHARHRLVAPHQPTVTASSTALTRDPEPRAIYIGDVRPSRGLWWMLTTIAEAPGWRLDIVGNVTEVTQSQVAARLDELGIDDRVTFHGRLPPDRAWSLATGAWCGLALLQDTPAYRAAIPTKIIEYQAAGLPVLSSPLPRVQRVLASSGSGETAASPQQAAAILRRWGTQRTAIDTMGRAGIDWARASMSTSNPFDEIAAQVATMVARSNSRDPVS